MLRAVGSGQDARTTFHHFDLDSERLAHAFKSSGSILLRAVGSGQDARTTVHHFDLDSERLAHAGKMPALQFIILILTDY